MNNNQVMTATLVSEAGYVNCLGWCNKQFYSPDRKRIRFCKSCAAKKDNAERSMAKIRSFGDDVKMALD